MYYLLVPLLVISFLSCSYKTNPDNYLVDIDHFQVVDSLYTRMERVEIIGVSNRVNSESWGEFYNLVVAVSQTTGDTFNILAYNYSNVYNESNLTFFPLYSKVGQVLIASSFAENGTYEDITEIKPPHFTKVFYDPDCMGEEVFNYPTTIGIVGDYTLEGDGLESLENW